MKKTIASLALLASATTAVAMPPPPGTKLPKYKTVCLEKAKASDGSTILGYCDESSNNRSQDLALAENGCAAGQAAMTVRETVAIGSCMPPGAVQL